MWEQRVIWKHRRWEFNFWNKEGNYNTNTVMVCTLSDNVQIPTNLLFLCELDIRILQFLHCHPHCISIIRIWMDAFICKSIIITFGIINDGFFGCCSDRSYCCCWFSVQHALHSLRIMQALNSHYLTSLIHEFITLMLLFCWHWTFY